MNGRYLKKRKLKFLRVSYGYADYHQDACGYEELLNKADAQMYAMKESRQIERWNKSDIYNQPYNTK